MALWYKEQLEFILAVTKMLNETMPELYAISNSGLHIHVELREDDTFRKLGEWSDEIAPDCWSYVDRAE
jgi:hypothetical protein